MKSILAGLVVDASLPPSDMEIKFMACIIVAAFLKPCV